MCTIIVTGCSTSVGKTIASAIITKAISGNYFKPIESGLSDTSRIKKFLKQTDCHLFSPAYSLKAPLSPHHAAQLENIEIEPTQIKLPDTTKPLIVETAGGILVPLRKDFLAIDLFSKWQAFWIVVSKNYLGSINHTLLTIEALKSRGITPSFLIFTGRENRESEEAILQNSGVKLLGRINKEKRFSKKRIGELAKQWKEQLTSLIAKQSGTLIHR